MVKEIHKEIDLITSYLNTEEKDKVRQALKLSEEAHSNQLRKSGDPFITHPLEVAKILTSIKLRSLAKDLKLNINNEKNKKIILCILAFPGIIFFFNCVCICFWAIRVI